MSRPRHWPSAEFHASLSLESPNDAARAIALLLILAAKMSGEDHPDIGALLDKHIPERVAKSSGRRTEVIAKSRPDGSVSIIYLDDTERPPGALAGIVREPLT